MNTISCEPSVVSHVKAGIERSRSPHGQADHVAPRDRFEAGAKIHELEIMKPSFLSRVTTTLKKGLQACCPIGGAAILAGSAFLSGPLGIAAGVVTGAIMGATVGGLLGFAPVGGLFYDGRAKAGAVLGAMTGAVGGGFMMAGGLGACMAPCAGMTGFAIGGVVGATLRDVRGFDHGK